MEVKNMARAKGTAPVKAETNEAQDQPAVLQPVSEEMVSETMGSEVALCEAVASESAAGEQENAVIRSFKAGAGAAKDAITNLAPAVGKGIRQVAYKGVYYISFGATFGALTVASLVPIDSFIGEAIAQGAKDAEASFKALEEKGSAVEGDASPDPSTA
jgi:hypothetical protein